MHRDHAKTTNYKQREGVSLITSTYAISLCPPSCMFNIAFFLLDLYIHTVHELVLVINLHLSQVIVVWTHYLLFPYFFLFDKENECF